MHCHYFVINTGFVFREINNVNYKTAKTMIKLTYFELKKPLCLETLFTLMQ